MTLNEQLREDLKQAMRSGDTFRRDVIRLVESSVKNAAIEQRKTVAELSDEDVQDVIRRGVKQRKDSITQYEEGGRPELAENERQELEILQDYLPQAMDMEEVRKLAQQAVTETNASSMSDFGKVMGATMKLVAGRAEGDQVKLAVEEILKG